MITDAHYTAITGSSAPDNFTARRDYVIKRIEAALGRKLRSAERTEICRVQHDGWVYVSAAPVTACDQSNRFGGDRIYVGRRLYGSEVSITYTGGYADYEAGEDHDLPVELAAAIAWGIHTLANPTEAPVPSGVTSLNIAGEFSVSSAGGVFGADGEPMPAWAAGIRDLGGRCADLAAPYRRVV